MHEARKGQLHTGLFTSEQVEPILREIQDSLKAISFPIQRPRISIDELMRISTITILCENSQLKVLIDVPLLEKYNYQAYKIHSLPINQDALSNGTGRVYITSKFNYLVVDEDLRTYLLLKEQEWNLCKSTVAYHACLKGTPIYEFHLRSSCEALLLIRPTVEALKMCDIRITTSLEAANNLGRMDLLSGHHRSSDNRVPFS